MAKSGQEPLVASLLLVVRPGAPSSVLGQQPQQDPISRNLLRAFHFSDLRDRFRLCIHLSFLVTLESCEAKEQGNGREYIDQIRSIK